MSPRVLHATRKEIAPAMRCARSGCKRVAVVVPGSDPQLCLAHEKKRRTNKYGSKRATSPLLGRSFHSQAERARGEELSLLERSGAIRNLRFQVAVPLHSHGKLICRWIADFTYEAPDRRGAGMDLGDGWWLIFHDEKGFRTPMFDLKAKLFEAEYGFPICVTVPPRRR